MCYFSVETKRHFKKALLAIPGVIQEVGDAFLLKLLAVRKATHSKGSVPTINTLKEILNVRLSGLLLALPAPVSSNATDLSFIKKTTEYVKSKIRVHLA